DHRTRSGRWTRGVRVGCLGRRCVTYTQGCRADRTLSRGHDLAGVAAVLSCRSLMIFLSYSREDKDVAANLAAILSERGFEIVRDPTLVRGDPFWRRTVRNSLDESELLVVLWSRHAAQSPWVDQEIRYFDKETHFVFLDKEKEQLRTGPHRAASREVENIITEIVHSLKRQQGGSTDKDVSSQRRDLVTAEEARLKSFCHDMGHRVANVTAVEDESLRLSDGTLMIR